MKKLTNLEMLRTATPEQITEMFCHEYLKNCSACPHFVLECCNGGKNGFAEWLNEEAKIPKDAPKDAPKKWIKLKNEICNEIGSCDNCPPAISKHCDEAFKAMKDWKKPHAPKDAPKDVFKGWVKLKTLNSTIRIDASKIVALGPRLGSTGTITKVYTIGAEWNPWLVCDTIDEVIGKIEKAKQEK